MLSEYRQISWHCENVKWGKSDFGTLHMTLWGELPQGPCPHDTPYEKSDLKPAHIIGSLERHEVSENDETSHAWRVYRDKHEDWDALWTDDGSPVWPNILTAANEALKFDLGGESLELVETDND